MKKTVEWCVLFAKSANKASLQVSGKMILEKQCWICSQSFVSIVFCKEKGVFSKLFLNFLVDEETVGSHVLAHGALSGGAKRNRRSATHGEILCRHIKGMKRDLEVWPIGRHKMFVVPGPLCRSTKGLDQLQERTTHSSFSCPKCRL